MFFVLSKIIYWLVMPISLIAWCVLISLIVKTGKLRFFFRDSGIILFFFFTNPLLATWVINSWEPDYKSYESLGQGYKYGIVLSGITNPDRPPFDRIQFNKGADRIVHTIDLYKLGIIEKILITGGSGALMLEGKKESHQIKNFAIQSGVAESDILLEDQARNTHENAQFSVEMLKGNEPGNILLITSAFHMYRARRCFEKQEVEVTTFPTDHYGREILLTPDGLIIPSLYGLRVWTILTKEWLGIVAYKLSGYV